MTTKELIEVMLALIGGTGGAATAGFTLASIRSKLQMDRLEICIKDQQLEFARNLNKTLIEGQLDFEQKVQQNVESSRVQVGELKRDVEDLKGVYERNKWMKPRKGFPPENISPHTDLT